MTYVATRRQQLGNDMEQKVLAHTIKEASRISGLGRTTLYAALKSGALAARKCGRRTVILAADLQAFLQKLPSVRDRNPR
jgi:excisionase family DNA binding protein